VPEIPNSGAGIDLSTEWYGLLARRHAGPIIDKLKCEMKRIMRCRHGRPADGDRIGESTQRSSVHSSGLRRRWAR